MGTVHKIKRGFPFALLVGFIWFVLQSLFGEFVVETLAKYGITVSGIVVWIYAHPLETAVIIFLLVLVFSLIQDIGEKANDQPTIKTGDMSPMAGRDHIGDIVYGDKVETKKKELQRIEANLRFEEYRDTIDWMIGLTVFNDDDFDLEEKTAELIGFAFSKIGNQLNNSIDMIPPERRILRWYESDSKIAHGGHSLTYISRVDWEGVHFCNLTLQHNSDYATWWAGVEIRGKMDGNPIVARRCCLSFIVRKHILENNREVWVVGHPTLETNDCDWAISLRGNEALKWLEENEQKKDGKKTKTKRQAN